MVYQILRQGLSFILQLFDLVILMFVHALVCLLDARRLFGFQILLVHISEQASPIELRIS